MAASKDHLSLFDSKIGIDTLQEIDPGPSSTGGTVDGYGSLTEQVQEAESVSPLIIQTHQDDSEDSLDETKDHFHPGYQETSVITTQATRRDGGAADTLKTTNQAPLNTPGDSVAPPPPPSQAGRSPTVAQFRKTTSNAPQQRMDSNHHTLLRSGGEPVDGGGGFLLKANQCRQDNRSSLASNDPNMHQYVNLGLPTSNFAKWGECSQRSMDSQSINSDPIQSSSDVIMTNSTHKCMSKNKGYESTSLRSNKWNIAEEEERFIVNDPNTTGQFDVKLSKRVLMEPPERLHSSSSSSLTESEVFGPRRAVGSLNSSSSRESQAFVELQTPKQRGRYISLIKSNRVESLREAKRNLEDSFSQLRMQRFQGPEGDEHVRSPMPPIRAASYGAPTFEAFNSSRQVLEPSRRVQSLPTPKTLPRSEYTFNHQSSSNMPVPTRYPDQRRESTKLPNINSIIMEAEESTSPMHMRRDSDRKQSLPADHMESQHAEPTVRTTSQTALETEDATRTPAQPAQPCPTCELRISRRNLMNEHRRYKDDPRASFDPRTYMEMNRSESFHQIPMQMDPIMAGFFPDPRAYMDPRAMLGADVPSVHYRLHNERLHTDPRATMAGARQGMGHSEPITNHSSPTVDPRIIDPRLMDPIPPIDPRMMNPRLMGYPGFPPIPMGWSYPPFGSFQLPSPAEVMRQEASWQQTNSNFSRQGAGSSIPSNPARPDIRAQEASWRQQSSQYTSRGGGSISSYSQDDTSQFVNPELSEHSQRTTASEESLPMHSPNPYPPYYDPYAYMSSSMSSYPPPSMTHSSGIPPAPLSSTPPHMDPVRPRQTISSSNKKVPTSVSSRPSKTLDEEKKKKQWTISGLLKKSSNVKFKKKSSSLVVADEDTASTLKAYEKGAKSTATVAAWRKKFFGRK